MTDHRDMCDQAQKLIKSLEATRDICTLLGDMFNNYEPPPGDKYASHGVYRELSKAFWKMSSDTLPDAIVASIVSVIFKESPSEVVPPSPDGNPTAHAH